VYGRGDLETFYDSQIPKYTNSHRHEKSPSDLLIINKQTKLKMMEKKRRALVTVDPNVSRQEAKKQKQEKVREENITFENVLQSFLPVDQENVLRILESSNDDDPPLIFLWNDLLPFLNHLASIDPAVLPQSPLEFEMNDPTSFKNAVLYYARNVPLPQPMPAEPQFSAILPMLASQLLMVGGNLRDLGRHEWFTAVTRNAPVDALPLATVVIPIPRQHSTQRVLASPMDASNLWGR
jgi:hypothetical protein